jgi:hypothetical protein
VFYETLGGIESCGVRNFVVCDIGPL